MQYNYILGILNKIGNLKEQKRLIEEEIRITTKDLSANLYSKCTVNVCGNIEINYPEFPDVLELLKKQLEFVDSQINELQPIYDDFDRRAAEYFDGK